MSNIQTFWLDGSFFLTFPYKIWGAQIAQMAVPRVSQFSMHAEKPLRITAFPWKKQKSQMCAPDLLLPVVSLFSEGELGRCRLQARGTAAEMVPHTLLIFFPRAHTWQHAPHGMQAQEPHQENRSRDLGFSLSKQLWVSTARFLCSSVAT